MSKIKDKRIWLTGASSGIGRALAIAFADRGAKLILSGRRQELLESLSRDLKGDGHMVLAFDLSDEDALNEAASRLLDSTPIDILVCNAGISQRSKALNTQLEVSKKIMDINFWSAVRLSKRVLPKMLEQGEGRFVVISSIVGKFGFPLRSAYAASKHALHGYFETLRLEHADDNIQVNIICPGRINTEISKHSLDGEGKRHGKMDDGQKAGMSAERCAEKIVNAILKNRSETLIGGKEIQLVRIRRFFPGWFRRIAKKVNPT